MSYTHINSYSAALHMYGVYCSTHSNKRPGNFSRYDKSHKQCAVGFVPIKGVCITSRYGYIGGDVALLLVYVVFYMSTETCAKGVWHYRHRRVYIYSLALLS